jgi:hypothetical protein
VRFVHEALFVAAIVTVPRDAFAERVGPRECAIPSDLTSFGDIQFDIQRNSVKHGLIRLTDRLDAGAGRAVCGMDTPSDA